MAELTPMMKQYMEVKKENKDSILFFRLGDFYEMFFKDAEIASRELELTLTGRDCGQEKRAPMCGVPYHAAQIYINRLVKKGYKVSICEQMEDPRFAKGIVKREIIKVVTPGTVTESAMLDDTKNNYIVAIYKENLDIGFAICDVTTGEFEATRFNGINSFINLSDEISRLSPSEMVLNTQILNQPEFKKIIKNLNIYISNIDEDTIKTEVLQEKIKKHIPDFDIEKDNMITTASGILLNYLEEMQKNSLEHINKIKIYNIERYMAIDSSTRRNLEITETMRDKSKKGTLLWVLDETKTAMGARMLRDCLDRPLINKEEINKRLDSVEALKDNPILRADIMDTLKKIYDIERLTAKITYKTANARDLIALKFSLRELPRLKTLLSQVESELVKSLAQNIDLLEDIENLIENSIIDEPPISVKEGGIIKEGYNAEVDKLRRAGTDGKSLIAQIEVREREKTGIKNLKISFNRVFGYYLEVTKSYLSLVPNDYIRKQTLANAERYITSELKELEDTILGAEERIIDLEYGIFNEIRSNIAGCVKRLQKTASTVAYIDTLTSLAEVAEKNNYIKPQIDSERIIEIKDGRHPVIEKILDDGTFIENDTLLDTEENTINIITGPNMAGKSTYMRQVALITLMAQCGSFVPAGYAKIGIADKIFTRVGASDDLAMGKSTFMVEMSEVANILNNATKESLVILDEIGRGTSTFDGLSIAWAVIEYISKDIGARTLFATHYHEITELEAKIENVKNYCISVKEKGDDIIFLRKIIRGGADGSYGIQVAKLAGVPYIVVNRAKQVLKELEDSDISKKGSGSLAKKKEVTGQVDLFNYKGAAVATELEKLNLDGVTPLDALNILYRLKEKF